MIFAEAAAAYQSNFWCQLLSMIVGEACPGVPQFVGI
jgi:hypothetical protein